MAVALTTAEIDLCIIIGNLFDNAIEANMALPKEERMIRVYMDMKNTQLYMSFTNRTAAKKQHKVNGRFLTSKACALGIKCTERSHWGSSISVVKAPSSLFLLIYP